MTEGIKKIRKGLVLLIEGMLEDTNDLYEVYSETEIEKRVLGYKLGKVENYLKEAKHQQIPEGDLDFLVLRYNRLRGIVKNLKWK